jgi:hypothetical protein
LIGHLTMAHVNDSFSASKLAHLRIALSDVWPQIEHMLLHLSHR